MREGELSQQRLEEVFCFAEKTTRWGAEKRALRKRESLAEGFLVVKVSRSSTPTSWRTRRDPHARIEHREECVLLEPAFRALLALNVPNRVGELIVELLHVWDRPFPGKELIRENLRRHDSLLYRPAPDALDRIKQGLITLSDRGIRCRDGGLNRQPGVAASWANLQRRSLGG